MKSIIFVLVLLFSLSTLKSQTLTSVATSKYECQKWRGMSKAVEKNVFVKTYQTITQTTGKKVKTYLVSFIDNSRPDYTVYKCSYGGSEFLISFLNGNTVVRVTREGKDFADTYYSN